MATDLPGGAHAAPLAGDTAVPTAYPDEADTRQGEPDIGQQSIGELLGQITGDLTALMHKEIELAKVEAREEARKVGKAAGMYGGAGVAGHMVALFLTVTMMFLYHLVMPWWAAAALVTAVWGLIALVLFTRGRKESRAMKGLPRTKETLKEDAQWARHPTS